MEEEKPKRKRGRPPKPESEKKKPKRKRGRPKKRGRKPLKRKRGRPRKYPLEATVEAVIEERVEQPVVESQVLPQTDEFISESLEIDKLLIDEQIFYSNQIARAIENQEEKLKPVINELDRIILGQSQEPEKLIGDSSIKISLSQRNKSTSDSNYTLDLSRSKKTSNQKPLIQNKQLYKEFRVENSQLEIPRLTLLKRNYFKEAYFGLVKFLKRRPLSVKKYLAKRDRVYSAPWWLNLKTALNFALIALLIVLIPQGIYLYSRVADTQGRVLGATEIAFDEFGAAVDAINLSDWTQAGLNFSQAGNYFIEAQAVLTQYNQSLVEFLESLPLAGQKVADGKKLLKIGELISRSATNFSMAIAGLNKADELEKKVSDSLPQINESLNSTVADLNEALNLFSEINPDSLPAEYRGSFSQIQHNLPSLLSSLDKVSQLIKTTFDILGYGQPMRYLFLFQNNNELRATGGFLGSFALVDVKGGQIVNLEVPGGGLYDLKADYLEKTISPEPMHLLGTPWMPWDQNWWPDFPTSARKLMQSFEKAGWPTYDGVFAINASVLPRLLEVLGNVELPDYNQLLTPDNVILALQHETEFEYDREENRPKKVIGDLLPVIIGRLMAVPSDQLLPLLFTFQDSFKAKDLQLYFTDAGLQQQASEFGWTGEIAKPAKDYLSVVRTNIAGGKTDLVIEQKIQHFAYIQSDGSVVDTVSVTLTHHGNPDDVFERARNNAYIRLYVPEGSQLVEVTGYDVIDPSLFKEVYEGFSPDPDLTSISGSTIIDAKSQTAINSELGKTVFGNWLQLDPGQAKTLAFSYRLPFRLDFTEDLSKLEQFLTSVGLKQAFGSADYSLMVQSQSGAKNTGFESRLYLPKGMNLEWYNSSNSQGLEVNENYLQFSSQLDRDYSYGALISR